MTRSPISGSPVLYMLDPQSPVPILDPDNPLSPIVHFPETPYSRHLVTEVYGVLFRGGANWCFFPEVRALMWGTILSS